ncbi:uncharacterized protein TNCV_2965111 [Trichonephila clavipes]|nr:uncharacterized protein TNCV_2965111 [Trichonephila clavipes]
MVSDGTEFAIGDIERLFAEARRNTKAKKCDDMEIRTGSSDSNSSRHESSSFDRVQRTSNELQSGRKKGSDVKRVLEEKGVSFKNDQDERHTSKTDKRGPLIRSSPSSWSQTRRKIKRSKNQNIGKIAQTGETVIPNTSNYNLRPRSKRRVESRPNMEMKIQQGGPVRSWKSKGRSYNPYIEDQTKSGNKNTRRRGNQQQKDQEREGGSSRRRELQVIKTRLYRFILYSFVQVVGRIIARSKYRSDS